MIHRHFDTLAHVDSYNVSKAVTRLPEVTPKNTAMVTVKLHFALVKII